MHGYYSRLLASLASSWRALFQTEFSIVVVQLAAYGGGDHGSEAARAADPLPALRAAQAAAVAATPRAALALALDIGDTKSNSTPPENPHCHNDGAIHPRNKTEVGRRIALALGALEGLLPPGVVATGPVPGTIAPRADGGAGATVTFAPASAPGGALALAPTADCAEFLPPSAPRFCCQTPGANDTFPFELRAGAGAGATYTLAAATLRAGGAVDVEPLGGATGPFTGVRFARQAVPLCVVVNAQGLPLAPFDATIA